MPRPSTVHMNLLRTYTHTGRTFGPGPAEVPEDAADDLREKEDEYRRFLAEGGEPHAPVTPLAGGLAPEPDPRLRKPGALRPAAQPQQAAPPPAPATAATPAPAPPPKK